MTYRFRPKTSSNAEMQRIAREQIASALGASAQQDEEQTTHQIRKHGKKMRALVRLVQKTDNNTEQLYRAENAHYRRIADLLSGSRDAVSLYDALAKQLDSADFPATAALLKSRIDTSGAREALQQTKQMLQQGVRQIDNWDYSTLSEKDLKRGYARSYQRAFKAMKKAFEDDDDGRMHTLRKRVKDQWYHTRLLQALKPKKVGRRRERLKALSSALGDWRDLRLLCAFLASHKEELGAEAEGELIPLLDAARQRLQALRATIGRECDSLFRHKRWKKQRK